MTTRVAKDRRRDGLTRYSETVQGDRGNYDQPVKFDITDGYVGITQFPDVDRVLLSPRQVTALVAFVALTRCVPRGGAR